MYKRVKPPTKGKTLDNSFFKFVFIKTGFVKMKKINNEKTKWWYKVQQSASYNNNKIKMKKSVQK